MKRSVLLALGLVLLAACSETIDRDRLAQSIQQDVIKQGGVSLKTVTCPKNIKPEAGQTFECLGETDTGYTFTIPVKQKDDQGNVIWDMPNAKGLLNLAKFETLIQAAMQSEIGSRPIIRCGGTYKAVKPGQTFECAVDVKAPPDKKPQAALKTIPVKSTKPDTILVMIDTDRNVNWQRVIPGAVNTATATKVAASKATDSKNAAQSTTAAQITSPTKTAPPAKSSAEDFLKQPGASDDF